MVVQWGRPLGHLDAGTTPQPREPRIDPLEDSMHRHPAAESTGWRAFSGVVDWLDEDLSEGF